MPFIMLSSIMEIVSVGYVYNDKDVGCIRIMNKI